MKLYFHPISGHSHRARLFLSLIGAQHELINVDLMAGAQKRPEFLKLNPFGQVPVLDDGGVIVSDSNAILVYLARKFGKTDWLPDDAQGAAAVQRWLSVAAGELHRGPARARLKVLFKLPDDAAELIKNAHTVLKLIDGELQYRDWIASSRPTIADVALYSYIFSAPEGNVDLAAYTNINAWMRRIEALPGFVPFDVNKVGLAA
ncbi:MAG: glutathione S-transferase [Proteobacteria bacterium SG_bin9]|nr:MAG: glutathione S-transferase [Proteobacteria bacterium SG_bin9]